ncbi:tetratricopeptide repeat protein [Streptomyces sp. NBC_01187]|uniref:tetratricopeptide repeat protein n=1 Tax=Streptomyces sp. NBC_01187 TaxID=2903766 RepID=UPI003864797F|nr:tetratricopeptide repeat protein [Streptomyces sp. NBC_01187]
MGAEQHVTAVGGFAYGAIGADIHVFGDGLPVYVLENWRRALATSREFLAELPSRMLNSRFGHVDFTGRDEELRELADWRDSPGARLAAHWLHGPGGQGKTRLAEHFAALSAADGWKVVSAVDGPGTVHPPPGSQDMRTDGAAGLLVLVDYAERRPGSHLRWLFSNALFHRPGVRTRILLLSRTAEAWPGLRASLADLQAATSSRFLGPLPGDDPRPRTEMFHAARDCFGALLGLDDPSRVSPPARLDRPEFGLTLTVHMAALVAVDAHLRGRRAPADETGLTRYLLDREHAHWERLFGDPGHELAPDGPPPPTPPPTSEGLPPPTSEGLQRQTPGGPPHSAPAGPPHPAPAGPPHRTPPDGMNRLVFTATLTGPLDRATAEAALVPRGLLSAPGRELADHARCYPPADPALDTVLEPLYPDRLAEDFLALTLAGHQADYPARDWAADVVERLLGRPNPSYPAARWTPRAITFLAAAAERWPHVGPACLFPLLSQDPGLAVAAGSAGLSALAAVGNADPELLETIETELPEDRAVDLDAGMAELVTRIGRNSLDLLDEPADRYRVHHAVGLRLYWAGAYHRAADALEEAVRECRLAYGPEPAAYGPVLAAALTDLGECYAATGRTPEAVHLSEEAVALLRRLAADGVPDADKTLAIVSHSHSTVLWRLDRRREALPFAREAVAGLRAQAADGSADAETLLAGALDTLGHCLNHLGSYEEAVPVFAEDVAIRRRLAAREPARFEPELAQTLVGLASFLAQHRRHSEALPVAREATAVSRRLSSTNPAAFQPLLASVLPVLAFELTRAERHTEALSAAQEAVGLFARLTEENPRAHEDRLAASRLQLSRCQAEMGRHAEAVATVRSALSVFDRLMEEDPAAHTPRYIGALVELGLRTFDAGRPGEALGIFENALSLLLPWAEVDPEGTAKDLTSVHTKRGNVLSALGRHEEALEAAREAAELLRGAAERQPAAFAGDLGVVLSVLADRLTATGRHEEARQAQGEADRAAATDLLNARTGGGSAPADAWYGAMYGELEELRAEGGPPAEPLPVTPEIVEFFRRLADDDFPRYGPHLAVMLSDVCAYFMDRSQPREAVAATEEAIALLRSFEADHPSRHAHDLARALGNLGLWLDEAGRPLEAVSPAEESVRIMRELAGSDPDAYEPDLARCLMNAGSVLSSVGRESEAATASEEAAAVLRRLTQRDPVRYEPQLGDALGNLGGQLAALGHLTRGVAATEEAVALYRGLAAGVPARYEEGLCGYLTNLSHQLSGLGRPVEAVAAAEEAVALARGLADAAPERHAALAGQALVRLAGRLSQADRDAEAVAAAGEAVGWFRRLDTESPRHACALASALADLGAFRANTGAWDEAVAAAAEARALFRRTPRDAPELFAVRYGESLARAERILSHRADEALALACAAPDAELVRRTAARLRPGRVLPSAAWRPGAQVR